MHTSSMPIAVHMHSCYLVHMHTSDEGSPQATAPTEPPTKKVIGGITLYATQLRKLAATGMSRSAVIRRLIDEHL
jgi:hypothetical protein